MNITIYFPVKDTTVVTVLEKGVLFGVQGAQGIQGIQGAQGAQGIQGLPGIGIASGGSIGQVLGKTSLTDYITGWLTLDKAAVGLSNVDNTSDINKPISTLVQNALNLKEGIITAGTTSQYYRGDKTFQTLDKTAVGLSNVDNTSDANKPISTATQTALNLKQDLNANLTSVAALTYASTSFVKMTAAGTFALDTNTYLTAESDTLASVTGRGNTTTNAITVGNLTVNGTIRNTIGSANLYTSNVIGGSTISLHSDTPISSNYFVRADTTSVILNAPQSNGSILFRQGNGSVGQFFGTTGNLTLQNGGTFTDASFRLDVNGTARIQNQLTTTGSITAASAIARGVYMNQTLVAAANNDVLVGLDIAPTFTNGAFTGVTNYALRVTGVIYTNTYMYSLGLVGNTTLALSSSGTNSISFYTNSTGIERMRIFGSTGNLTLQNGGTFTDAGYRLDVNGTARVSNVLTLGSLSSDPTGSNGMIYYNTTSNTFKVYQNGAWKTITAI